MQRFHGISLNKANFIVGLIIVCVGVGMAVLVRHNSHTDFNTDQQQISANPVTQSYKAKLGKLQDDARTNPNSSAARSAYAEALYITGDKKTAASEYEAALKSEPTNATVQNNLGNTYRDLGDHKKAEQAYQRSLELAPSDQKAYLNLANMQLYTLHDPDAAVKTYKTALEKLGSPPQIKILLGLAYEQANQQNEAKAVYRSILAVEPGNEAAKNNLERINK